MPRPISYAVFCLKKKSWRLDLAEGAPKYADLTRPSAEFPSSSSSTIWLDGYAIGPPHLYSSYDDNQDLHSFPTRRSSDLNSTKHKSPHLSGWRQIISLIT